jgi:hypothetical protein
VTAIHRPILGLTTQARKENSWRDHNHIRNQVVVLLISASVALTRELHLGFGVGTTLRAFAELALVSMLMRTFFRRPYQETATYHYASYQ